MAMMFRDLGVLFEDGHLVVVFVVASCVAGPVLVPVVVAVVFVNPCHSVRWRLFQGRRRS